jgi:uncharacterized surface protein with fasciclin (FAS1) repeats
MRNVMNSMQHLLLLLFLSSFLFSCENKMDEHYEKPAWLKGSAWEVLANEYEGRYSIFLEAAELAGFRPVLEGKGLATVMAPDNDAFTVYLEKEGYASVRDIPVDDFEKLIGFHLVYYSYNKSDLENYRPTSDIVDEEEDTGLQPGMYYKFRTRSSSPASLGVDPATNELVTVYHLERFVPVFSHYMFASKGIDAKKNYEYFYPASVWTGDAGFNVSNASVNDYQIIANNGYIYAINQVLEPLETIYTIMKDKKEYSKFLDFYNSFSTFTYDEQLTADFAKGMGVDKLYLFKHEASGLPNIALEWPVSNYRLIPTLASESYSVFAPTNKALEEFFTRFWKQNGYNYLEDVDPLIIKILILQYIYSGAIVFPDEVQKITNDYGTSYNFDPYNVKDKSICVNGSFYGLDEIDTPPIFNSVIGPAFSHKDYRCFLYALDGAEGLLKTYSSLATKYTMLIPDDATFKASDMEVLKTTSGTYALMEPAETESGMGPVGTAKLQRLINVHTVSGEVALPAHGTKVYTSQNASTYWFIKDGKITTNAIFNGVLGMSGNDFSSLFSPLEEITNNGEPWSNGKSYVYKSNRGLFDIDGADAGENYRGMKAALATCVESKYPYFVFAQLLKQAGMVNGTDLPDFQGRAIAFIPTNEVLVQAMAEGKIPGVKNASVDLSQAEPVLEGTFEPQVLKKYLKNYFLITRYAPEVTSCPYIGSTTWKTGTYRNANDNNIIYTDNGETLSVQLDGTSRVCSVVPTYYYFPFAYNDGGFHLIDSVF